MSTGGGDVGGRGLHPVARDDAVSGVLDRALLVLETAATAGPEGLPLGEIAARTGIDKGSVHRLLRGLAYREYMVRYGEDRDYALGEATCP
ncbi:helix-turn-helix domain-containing protein [Saccharomonospora sp.]|uniref:helix-turn-helix domain-containing protein n=1 Tax=Saccharomonospora sp. TaxID=33913 RepID=UPI002615D9D3|nr:helix-turn-helix domain-containing protein [Saccharomonospora sp.]